MRESSGLSPKVREARTNLLDLIAGLSDGDALPSERHLVQAWGLSRMTLRRAADDLVNAGILDRHAGSGTFLTRPRITRPLSLTSFSEDLLRQGRIPGSSPVSFRLRKANRTISQKLRVPIGEEVFDFTRLRSADSEPIAIERTMIRASMVPGLSENDLHQSWYQTLEERYGIVVDTANGTIFPIIPDSQTQEYLGVPSNQPCLSQEMYAFDRDKRMISIGDTIYRGDLYSLEIHISR